MRDIASGGRSVREQARIFLFFAMTTASVVLPPSRATASEPFPTRAEMIASPGRSAATDDTTESISLNPANLAFLPGAEFRWTGLWCADTAKVGCGHAFGLGTPLPFRLGTGLRVDAVLPPGSNNYPRYPYDGTPYVWITWGLGFRLFDGLAFGASIQGSYSSDPYTNKLFGVTAGLTLRPDPHLALAAVAHDFNGPSMQNIGPNGLPVLDRRYVLAAAVRPTGRRSFEIAAEMTCLDGSRQWLPKGLVGVDIPHVGRARGDIEFAHLTSSTSRSFIASLGLELNLKWLTVGGGAFFGSGLGSNNSVGEFATASIAAYRSPGLPGLSRAVSIRIEKTPDNRDHVALLRRLWTIAENREIVGVALVLRAEPAESFAHAEEIADAIRLLRTRGKKVVCSWEDNGAKSLYVCANADRTVVNPAGGLRYAGLRSQYLYLAKMLSHLGIKGEFIRVSDHKTAPEQFTHEHPSAIAHADHLDLMDQTEREFVRNVSAGRKRTVEQVREATLKGPFIASEAKEAGFVDGFAFDDELESVMQDVTGRSVSLNKYADETRAPPAFGVRRKVAVLYVEGDMIDGRSMRVPLIDMRLVGSYSMADQIRALREDKSIRAVVLRIESPGGSSMAADVIWRELLLLADTKPLIVSMGSVAASGGYYIASAAKTIYALPLTVTGSIGVYYGKADVSELLRWIGVGVETYKTAPRADAESIFRGFTDEERAALERKVEQFYGTFLSRVSAGRNMTHDQVDAVGQGRVWVGRQAKANGLVDHLGGLREALDAARAQAGLPPDAPIVEYPPTPSSLLEKAIEFFVDGHSQIEATFSALPPQIQTIVKSIAPMMVYTGETPLARLEWTFDP